MEYFSCIFTEYRKDSNNQNPPLKIHTRQKKNTNCSSNECMLKFTDTRPCSKMAKIGKRCYGFCNEDCYINWLKMPIFYFSTV